ncbi:MAG: OmpH family outer membrane protein [Tepidisphaerales bacterium]
MNYRCVLSWLLLVLPGLAPLARADDPVRVAVCNVGKVFEQLDERKAQSERFQAERDGFRVQLQRRQAEIKDIQEQLNNLKPDSPAYNEKTQLLMQKVVDMEVWARLQEAEQARKEKEAIKRIYDKIAAACQVVAEQKKLDLVLAEHKPEIPNPSDPKISPDQVRLALSQTNVLYKNDKADVTQAVILQLNQDYLKGPTGSGK